MEQRVPSLTVEAGGQHPSCPPPPLTPAGNECGSEPGLSQHHYLNFSMH